MVEESFVFYTFTLGHAETDKAYINFLWLAAQWWRGLGGTVSFVARDRVASVIFNYYRWQLTISHCPAAFWTSLGTAHTNLIWVHMNYHLKYELPVWLYKALKPCWARWSWQWSVGLMDKPRVLFSSTITAGSFSTGQLNETVRWDYPWTTMAATGSWWEHRYTVALARGRAQSYSQTMPFPFPHVTRHLDMFSSLKQH